MRPVGLEKNAESEPAVEAALLVGWVGRRLRGSLGLGKTSHGLADRLVSGGVDPRGLVV